MRPISPEATAFVLAQRNFDAIPLRHRGPWFAAFQNASRTRVPMPDRIVVELANTCNLDCPTCRVGQHGVNPRRVMPLDTFRRIASEIFPHVREVRLNGLGESTVVPAFEEYLDVLASYPVAVELITNGTAEARTYRRLLDDDATLLFSWDAATPRLFSVLRRPADMERVREVVEEAARHARVLGRSDNLHLLFTLVPANIEELPAVVTLSGEMGIPNVLVNVAKLATDDWMPTRAREVLAAFKAADATARPAGVRLFLPDTFAGERVELTAATRTAASGCDRPWREVVIRWDLDVQVCNMFNPYTYGNLLVSPFPRIWTGAFAATFRENFKGAASHPYCSGCAYIGEVYAHKRG